MLQHEILQAGPLLNENGVLREPGWAKRMLLQYDRAKIRAGRFRIKEWDYYLVANEHFALALTVDDNSYMGLYSASLLDFETGWQHTISPMVAFPMGKTRLPSTSLTGDVTSLPNKKYSFRFCKTAGRRILDCHMDDFFAGQPLDAHVELEDADEESMVIATPFHGDQHAFYYNQKINCMPAQGTVSFRGAQYEFEAKNSFGTLDWGRGVWTRDNTWYWSSGNGLINGRRFGFNLGCGFGDTSAASENMLFYDGKAHKLGHVTFDIPQKDGSDDYMSIWHFKDEEGRLSLEFVPLMDRASRTDIKLICSDQHQVFGYFSGTAVLDDGTVLPVERLLAFAEKVHNKW